MPESPVRVALLARAGEVRQQLHKALTELGADVVAEGDPAELDPGTVAGRQPSVVVVSLEPAIEESLAEYEELLAMPGVQVIYDDAEVTGQLDGWDLARWARHLASKLTGSNVVLPPAPDDALHDPEPEPLPALEPGAPPTPAEEMDHHRLEDYAAESLDLSEWVPTTPSLTEVAVDDVAPVVAAEADEPSLDLELDLDLDLEGLESAMAPRADAPAPAAPVLDASDDFIDAGADADAADLGDFIDLSIADSLKLDDVGSEPAADAADEPLLVDFEMQDGPIKFSSFTDDDEPQTGAMDDDVAALAAQLDAFESDVERAGPRDPDFLLELDDEPSLDLPGEPAPKAATAAAPVEEAASFGNLSLMPMDGDIDPSGEPLKKAPPPEPVKIDFGSLSLADAGVSMSSPLPPAEAPSPTRATTSTLSLADDDADPHGIAFGAPATPAAISAVDGALFVLAGLGGPDGVRQLLSALPENLPVPVLLYQHLDTGKHDRLVGQLAKASRLPVELAVEGAKAVAGRVSVLPPGLGVAFRDRSFSFVPGTSLVSVVSALPAADSAVLVLSGGDPRVVPAVQELQAAGGQVYAQDPASCFDAGAAQALIATGATTAPLPGLARLIIERWS